VSTLFPAFFAGLADPPFKSAALCLASSARFLAADPCQRPGGRGYSTAPKKIRAGLYPLGNTTRRPSIRHGSVSSRRSASG
jgi:hypothetical protein